MDTRLERQQAAQRPPYPQISTATMTAPSQSSASSAFQSSSSSLASVQSPGSTTMQSPMGFARQNPFSQSSAPLPSPHAQQSSNYFGSINAASIAQRQQNGPASNQTTSMYVGQRGDNGGQPETAPFLDNFNLVAEAAKRAQMACLMRDLGDVEL